MNYDEQDKEAFEAQIEETDTKAVLLGIHAELQAIRTLLEGAESTESESLTCATCGENYPSEKQLRQHAQKAHKAPSNMPLEDIADV